MTSPPPTLVEGIFVACFANAATTAGENRRTDTVSVLPATCFGIREVCISNSKAGDVSGARACGSLDCASIGAKEAMREIQSRDSSHAAPFQTIPQVKATPKPGMARIQGRMDSCGGSFPPFEASMDS